MYWADRMAKAQTNITNKNIRETEKQLSKYYSRAMNNVINEFETTYHKVLTTIDDGREPTPADLYKLDKYWQMQGQLKQELQKLGDKQILLLSKQFEEEWGNIYDIISLPSGSEFSTIANENVTQMINQIWCADGKSWSERVWKNTEKLQEALNDGLIECLLTGKTTKDLKRRLIDEFGVSYSRADAVVRTEMAHIQTQAARQRYLDAGVKEVEILADEDERRCEICGKLHQKRYNINEQVPIPAHPRCRCCIIPVIDDEVAEKPVVENEKRNDEKYQQQIRARREAYKNRNAINIDNMNKKDIVTWSKENLKTQVDYKGASEEATKIVAKTLKEIEASGVDLEDVKVVFGGAGGHYAAYTHTDKTIHLPRNTNFVEKLIEEDNRAKIKLGKTQHSVSSYKGTVLHEIGHAIDDIGGDELSRAISSNQDLYAKAVKISNYAGTKGAYGKPKASEATAENIAAYFNGADTRKNVSPEIEELFNKYFKKKKKK